MMSPTMLRPATEALDRCTQAKLPMRSDGKLDFDTNSLFRQIMAVDAPLLAFPVIEWSDTTDTEAPRKMKPLKKKVSKKSKLPSKHCMLRSKSLHQGLCSLFHEECPVHYF